MKKSKQSGPFGIDKIHDTYRKLFKQESDRAAAILGAAAIDDILERILKQVFVANPTSKDELFDGPAAPLGSSASRIELCHRLGLISGRLARDLDLVRRIRNDFAHNIASYDFSIDSVKARVGELAQSFQHFLEIYRGEKGFEVGVRGDFLLVTTWMIHYLSYIASHSRSAAAQDEEWPYLKEMCEIAAKDLREKEKNP